MSITLWILTYTKRRRYGLHTRTRVTVSKNNVSNICIRTTKTCDFYCYSHFDSRMIVTVRKGNREMKIEILGDQQAI
jgi:hypothetical protein